MKVKNYLLGGRGVIGLCFMGGCREEEGIGNGDGSESGGKDDDGNKDENRDGGNGERSGEMIVWGGDSRVNVSKD